MDVLELCITEIKVWAKQKPLPNAKQQAYSIHIRLYSTNQQTLSNTFSISVAWKKRRGNKVKVDFNAVWECTRHSNKKNSKLANVLPIDSGVKTKKAPGVKNIWAHLCLCIARISLKLRWKLRKEVGPWASAHSPSWLRPFWKENKFFIAFVSCFRLCERSKAITSFVIWL